MAVQHPREQAKHRSRARRRNYGSSVWWPVKQADIQVHLKGEASSLRPFMSARSRGALPVVYNRPDARQLYAALTRVVES
ncbi:hypothetical protein ACWDY7_16485 [Streptomyces calvus]|uniref:Uncharacterized protein n=1 Tax=Streptomyces calvus TaxID=67282 RepID=A0AA40SKD8_9ACTN|nr:hypothetical protein [Streptomyces calvus]MBA8948069.1 hypothetical protein [Streptomyces calvus]GGP64976.1 hypothetical protein GCM10010247_42050 [Streptomyces calvus]